MNTNSTSFNLSEEAFLLSSLREVTKVWARSSGKANFNFSVPDGQAHLQIGFHLGLPQDHHLPPQQHDHDPSSQHRYKGSVRIERDRARAAKHQASLKAKSASNSNVAVSATSSTTTSLDGNQNSAL